MGKLRSGRVKRIPQIGITSDRYEFLGLNQAEPNLGDPKVGPSSVGVNPIKAGAFYQLAAIGEYPGERYWSTQVGIGSTLGVISVYANNELPNSAFERIHGLNFVGTGVTLETPPLELFDGIGIATIRFTVTDILNRGDVGQVLYNTPSGYAYGANQLYYVSDNVGIGSTIPQYKLDILGDARLDGKLSVGGTTGIIGQYLTPTGAGVTWSDFPVLRTGLSTIATVGQTGFSTSYNVGFLDVFVNGIRLTGSEYVATNGNTIILNAPCFGGEAVDILAYGTVSNGSGSGGIGGGGEGESYWVQNTIGIHTLSLVGIGTTNPTEQLTVYGDTRVTGILTVGTASITLNGSTNEVNIGSGVSVYGDSGEIYLNGVLFSSLGISSSFSSLSDVNVSAAETGKALIYNEGQWIAGPTIGGIPGIPTSFNLDSTLLILGDGTNGDNTFIDSSIVGAALTSVGSGVYFSDTQAEFGTTSIYFDGASYIDVQVSTGVTFASYEDFTLEFWSYQTNNNGYFAVMQWDDDDYEGLYIYDGYLNWYEWNEFTGNTYISENTWHHIAVTRQGNILRYYVDGVLDVQQSGFGLYSYSGYAAIGVNGARDGEYFEGYLDGINFVKGTALYTESSFTIPTSEFTDTIPVLTTIGGIPYSIKNFDDVSDDSPINNQVLVWGGTQYNPGLTYSNNNIFLGNASGCFNTSGSNNVFFGNKSGYCNDTGSYNNFFGKYAGYYSIDGCCNNFFGLCAGYSNDDGYDNNFFGSSSGHCNTTGSYNNFLGYQSGYCNNVGEHNNFFGFKSGYYNKSGSNNNFFGYQSGFCNDGGSSNTFIGPGAGRNNINGSLNNFIGSSAGYYNTTSYSNNFFGHNSGYDNTTGCGNVFLGDSSGSYNTVGNLNTLIGASVGLSISASNRVIIGSSSYGFFDSPDINKDVQFAVGVKTDSNLSNYWLVGDENFNIGIGTITPTEKLTVGGTVLATDGFISIGNTTPIQITLVGNQLIFTAVGIGSTTLTLS